MSSKVLALLCLQAFLVNNTFALPSYVNLANSNTITTNVPSTVLSGTIAQSVAPSFSPNWPINAQQVPVVTEILPSLNFGEMSVDGDMPVGGLIKISGTFPVFGNIAVDGSVPSFGTGYVDAANLFGNECASFN